MPRYEITSPDGKRFEVNAPDGASHDDVLAYAQSNFKPTEPYKPVSPTDDMGTGQRLLAGIGGGMVNLGRGVGQVLGMVSPQDVSEARKYDAPLMNTGAGATGNFLGTLATAAPAMMIPGANSVAGAAITGGLMSGLQPVGPGESRAQNAALGAVTGGVGQKVLGVAGNALANRLATKEASEATRQAGNAVTDAAITEAKGLGYNTVPSISNGSFLGRIIEGATGKEKAKQLASVNNQPVTDALARKLFGLADDVPLSRETMKAVRSDAAAKGYEPVRQVPAMETDSTFRAAIDKLTSRADNASKDFGDLVKSDIKPFADGLKEVKSFTGSTAIDAVSIFREKASELYAQGNKTLGQAYRQAAEAIEGQVERGLARGGKDGAAMIKDFRDARMKMAQTFDLEKAIREGEGNVDLRVLGKMYNKNPERMSGDLRTMGRIGAAMPEVTAVPKEGWSNPITALDSGFATFGGILAGNPAPLAYPLARAVGRYGLLSGPGQKMFTTPKYGPGILDQYSPEMLKRLEKMGAGGILGYSAQQ